MCVSLARALFLEPVLRLRDAPPNHLELSVIVQLHQHPPGLAEHVVHRLLSGRLPG